jgi:hypothetical protein
MPKSSGLIPPRGCAIGRRSGSGAAACSGKGDDVLPVAGQLYARQRQLRRRLARQPDRLCARSLISGVAVLSLRQAHGGAGEFQQHADRADPELSAPGGDRTSEFVGKSTAFFAFRSVAPASRRAKGALAASAARWMQLQTAASDSKSEEHLQSALRLVNKNCARYKLPEGPVGYQVGSEVRRQNCQSEYIYHVDCSLTPSPDAISSALPASRYSSHQLGSHVVPASFRITPVPQRSVCNPPPHWPLLEQHRSCGPASRAIGVRDRAGD